MKACLVRSSAPMWMLYVAFAVLVALAVALVYMYVIRGRKVGMEGFEHKKAKFVFLYMKGCVWCDRFKPTWEDFEAKHGKGLAAKGVVLASYERAEPESKAYEDYVQGYPTILLAPEGGEVVKFAGERTSDGMLKFLSENDYQL